MSLIQRPGPLLTSGTIELQDTSFMTRPGVATRSCAPSSPQQRAVPQKSESPAIPWFEWAATKGRAVQFRGLMAPGSPLVPPDEQLVALWRNRGGQRFQNYRATFTVLDANPLKADLAGLGSARRPAG